MTQILRFKSSAWGSPAFDRQEQALIGFGGRKPATSLQQFLGPMAWVFPEAWGWRVGTHDGGHACVYQEACGVDSSAITIRMGERTTEGFRQKVEQWAAQQGDGLEWQTV